MTSETQSSSDRTRLIIIVYPLAILAVGVGLNLFVFGVVPATIALPPPGGFVALIVAAALLVFNHSWIMTTTELTRLRFGLYATPEEWAAAGKLAEDAPPTGIRELQRHHDTHANTTENTVYFALLAPPFLCVSPPEIAAQVYLLGYAVARLGYTYSFLRGLDNARGLFMTLSLLPMYAMASYLLFALWA